MRTSRTGLALAALLLSVTAACSGSDEDASPTSFADPEVSTGTSEAAAVTEDPADEAATTTEAAAATGTPATETPTTESTAPTGTAAAASTDAASAGGTDGSSAGGARTGTSAAGGTATAPVPTPGSAATPTAGGQAPVAPPLTGVTTARDVDKVFDSAGYPAAIWSITDRTGEAPLFCEPGSGSIDGPGYVCGSSADNGVACLPNPLAEDEVVCITDPIAHTGYRAKAQQPLAAPAHPGLNAPLRVELTDGTRFALRSGGTGLQSPEGLYVAYWCDWGDCQYDALWGGQGHPPVDTSGTTWTSLGADDGQMSVPVEIARAWYVRP